MFTLTQIETMLASGKMAMRMRSGRLWTIRRNGATKTWKRSPTRFRIPVKAGLATYDEINEHTLFIEHQGMFVI